MSEHVQLADSMGQGASERRAMLYPNLYAWFIFVSVMDVLLTWAILNLSGTEVNPLAALVMEVGHRIAGEAGRYIATIFFKLMLTLSVILICDFIGRGSSATDYRKGKRLAQVALAVSTVPILWSLTLLATRLG